MQLFKRNSKGLVGLDVCSTSVKLVEIVKQQGRFQLLNYGIEPLEQGAVVEKNITNAEAVGDAIARLVQKTRPNSKIAATAVSGSAVITKVIDMEPNLSEIEREAQIRLDADQYIPYPLSEVNLDFEVLGPSEVDPKKVSVLLAASRSENVDQRSDAVLFGGLETKVVDIEAYAIERAFNMMIDSLPSDPEVVALVDIGHTQTILYVFNRGKMIYSREQLFGGAQLTESIQSRYGLTFEEANKNKRNQNLPDDYQSEVLTPFMESVVQQITRSLQFFFSSSQFHDVDHIVLSGGSAAITGLTQLVESKLGNSVTVANPFVHMSLSNKINSGELAIDAPGLMVACGLGLRSFD